MKVTIDASVFVTAARPMEVEYAISRSFLQAVMRDLQEGALEGAFMPTLVLTECSAAIGRQVNPPALAEKIVALIESMPNVSFISLDVSFARYAAKIARDYRLR